MALMNSSVVRAKVIHHRRVPVPNRFVYGIDYVLLDQAVLEGQEGPSLFSFGRPNLVSLHPSDHGISEYQGPEGVRRLGCAAGIDDIEQVLLLTHPRYWGYTFNPVSFWFMLASDGRLRAVLAEVHNTFGERHGYLCTGVDGTDISRHHWTVLSKCFHVSPYFDLQGEYRFQFLLDDTRVAVRIIYDDGTGGGLNTAIVGIRWPFNNQELIRALLRRPWGAARTTALIHWQALRLRCKGVRYRPHPPPPNSRITS